MNKRLFMLLLLGSMATTGGFAQNNSIGNNDPEAKKILDQISNKIKSYHSVQAGFELKIEDAKGNLEGTKKGVVYMKGIKYRVTISGQDIFCDGKNIWTYDKSANEVTVTKFDPSSNSITAQKLFTNFYDKDFLYKLNGSQKHGNKMLQEIEMTPVDKTKNFFKIYLYVDNTAKTVVSSKMLDKSGNKYTYTINNLNGNAQLSDATFTFDKTKYPGVEVVDLNN